MSKKFSILGYACGLGAGTPGAALAPQLYRRLGLLDRLTLICGDVRDCGDITSAAPSVLAVDGLRNLEGVSAACVQLHARVSNELIHNRVPVVLGGDHSCSIGTVTAVAQNSAAQAKQIGLLWVDTHPDINTPMISPSGNIHGMSTAFLLGAASHPAFFNSHAGPIAAENIAYLGLRDVDLGEREIMRRLGVRVFTMTEIDRYGIGSCTQQALEVVSQSSGEFVVSFDLDVCDPSIVPGTGTRVRGGLTFREAHLVLEMVAAHGGMCAAEVVELNPTLDRNFESVELGMSLLESLLGKTII